MAAVLHQPAHAWRGNVLLVDDCPTILAWMGAALEARGWQVLALDDGASALEVARRMCFDVIVLDVEMPGMDGLTLGRALRQDPRTAHCRIAIHSGLDEAQVCAGFSGYDAYLPKVGNPLLLRERLEQLLQGAEAGPRR